jgi:hypothetical protein
MNSLLSLVVASDRYERTRVRHDLLALADAALTLAQPVARSLPVSGSRPTVTARADDQLPR